MKHHLPTVAALALCGLFSSPTADAQTVTPVQWLDSQPQPFFKAGHTLPRLTRYGWSALGVPTRVKMCENWGYTLDFTRYALTQEVVSRLDDPSSDESQMAALNRSNPQRYPLSVSSNQGFPGADAPYASWTRDANGVIQTGSGVSFDGTTWAGGNGPLYSTEAPDLTWQMAGEMQWGPLRTLRERGVPVSIVLNGAEAGLGVPGFAAEIWNRDPTISAAIGSSPWGPGDMNNYAGAKMANTVKIVADAARVGMPQQDLYIYYAAGGGGVRNKDWAIDAWGSKWEHLRGTAKIPTNELYHNHFHDGFVGRLDGLTVVLNAASLEIATGDPLSYNWISGGWTRGFTGDIADYDRWAGFLKCFYTAGMIGSNTGHYGEGDNNNNFFDQSFPANAPPYWLKQLTISSHIHALFSQVEGIVRNSDLLPGPAYHHISPTEPAYEFPTGDDTARVLARKHRTDATWLITAWAADGADRNVSVYIPELGQLSVQARIVGSVYTATLSNGQVTMTRIDNEGATYSAVANGTPVVTPVNLVLPPPLAADRLVWLSADSGVIADAAGKVSNWGNQGGNAAFSMAQTNTAKQPSLITNAINGKPAIRFVNSQSWLEASGMGVGGDDFISPLTVFAVYTGAEVNGNKAVVTGFSTSDNYNNGDAFLLSNRIDSSSELDNGVMLKSQNVNLAKRLSLLVIGNTNNDYGYGLTGDVAEVLIYKSLTPLKLAQVQLYLNDKYNIKPNTTLKNGGFEYPQVNGYLYNPWYTVTRSDRQPTWLFANYSIVQSNGSAWGAPASPEGTQTGVLQGYGNKLGSMSQTVNFAAGNYTVSFKAARRDGQIQPLKVSLGSKQIGALITPGGNSFQDFTTVSFPVTAGYHVLRIEATDGSGDKSTFIDQVLLNKIAAATAVSFGGGSFETPAVNGYQYNPTGSGWNFTSRSVIQSNGSAWSAANAPAGIQTAVLQGAPDGLGAISQESTFAAGTYTVSFQAARRGGQIQPIKISIDGTQVGGLISPTSTAFEVYYTAPFTVTAGNHTLKLEATDGADDKSAFIDDVQLNTALGSLNSSIGTVNPVGSGTLSGAGVYTITGSGLGITGAADKGHLYYDKLTGNGSIVAKVLSVQNTNASAKAGIMIRETTATGSKNVFLAFTPNGTVNFQRRTTLSGATTNTTAVAAIPSWIKLTRVGNTFQAYRSTNGTTWVAVGAAATVAMTSDVFIGLGVSSNTSTTACTATFSNVTLTGAITRL